MSTDIKRSADPKYFMGKYLKVILLLGFLILISIPLIEMIYLLGIKGLFGYFSGKIVDVVGVNQYLAKGVTLVLVIPLFWSFRWMLSFKSARRRAGYLVIVGYMALFYFTMYFLTKGQKFEHATGKATKYYAYIHRGKALSYTTPLALISRRDRSLNNTMKKP